MTFATCALLKRFFPSCNIKILSTRSQIDKNLYKKFDIIEDRRTSLTGVVMCAIALIWHLVYRLLGVDLKNLRRYKELNIYFESDLIIDLSGDTITEDYGPLVLLSHCLPLMIAKCFHKPFVLFGQTIGPFSWTKQFIVPLLRMSDKIIARDDITYKYLGSLGIEGCRLSNSMDMAFMLEPDFSLRARKVEKTLPSLKRDELTLGMTVSYQYRNFLKKQTGKDLMTILPAVIDRLTSEHCIHFIFFPHVTGPGRMLDDRKMASDVIAACHFKRRLHNITEELSPQEIKALISKCDLFCGARMHSNIAAITTCVPTIAMSYSVKSRGIMSRAGLETWVIEPDQMSYEFVYNAIRNLKKKRHEISERLKALSPQMSIQSEANISTIIKIMNRLPVQKHSPNIFN